VHNTLPHERAEALKIKVLERKVHTEFSSYLNSYGVKNVHLWQPQTKMHQNFSKFIKFIQFSLKFNDCIAKNNASILFVVTNYEE
jgi:hypothetical protein